MALLHNKEEVYEVIGGLLAEACEREKSFSEDWEVIVINFLT